MAVATCVKAFILALLCGNPILRGTFVTILNSLLLKLSFDIDQINLLIGRLNIHNQILSLGINTLNALKDKVASDMNLLLGPIQQFEGCLPIQKIATFLQENAVAKKAKAFEKKISDINRVTNLVNIQNSLKLEKEAAITSIQDFIDEIANLCN